MLFILSLSKLPMSVLYMLSDALFFVAYRLVRYRRDMVRKNLKNAFPKKSEKEIRSIRKDFYRRLCDHAVETIKLLTISKDELKKRMVIEDMGVIQQYKEKGKGQPLIGLTSHQFNWEWMLGSISILSPVSTQFVYQPQQNHFADQLLLRVRTRFQAYAIKRGRVVKEMISQRDVLRIICIVADQFPGHANDKKYWTRFLNQDTAFFQGASKLAHLLEYPVMFLKINRVKRGYYTCKFIKIASPPYGGDDVEIVEKYAKEVEKTIEHDVPGWLWSHNRWK